jgi:hypothetical protein
MRGIRKYHRHFLWILLGILFILDIITTTIGIQAGGVELNPHMVDIVKDPVLHTIAKINAYILILAVYEGYLWFIKHITHLDERSVVAYAICYGTLLIALIWVNLIYTLVIISNVSQLININLL